MTNSPIQIVLVDDHKMLREGLRVLLQSEADFSVIGEAGTAAQAVNLVHDTQPDVVILDLGLPDSSGLDVIRKIRAGHGDTRIVVLSMHTNQEFVKQAIEAGCDGYVPKSSAHKSLIRAIRVVQAGERYLHPVVAKVLFNAMAQKSSETQQFNALSEREQEVIRQTALGYTSKEIGAQLYLSPKTVETYRQRALEKLNIERRADLVRFALAAGLMDDLNQQ